MKELKLTIAGQPAESTICFGSQLFPEIARTIGRDFPRRRVAVVSDETVASLFAATLLDRFAGAGLAAELLTFPPGEASKNRSTKGAIEDALFCRGFGRDSVVVALGGGVTGDLAGFVAATFCRGVPLIQVPTTVLAMADSSIGGKTGIDVPAGKNLVGAFHQPRWVFIDPDLLSTLPERELRAGLVEVVKHGLIADGDLFRLISRRLSGLLRPAENAELFNEVLLRSCSIKASIVRQDEREGGLRQILNFGHTVGHALESLSGWKLLHGEAVSLGIVAASAMSCDQDLLTQEEAEEIAGMLERLGTPTRHDFAIDGAILRMRHDKKVREGAVRFVLLRAIGRVAEEGSIPVPEQAIRKGLAAIGGRA